LAGEEYIKWKCWYIIHFLTLSLLKAPLISDF
jgi:hypothetical protein